MLPNAIALLRPQFSLCQSGFIHPLLRDFEALGWVLPEAAVCIKSAVPFST